MEPWSVQSTPSPGTTPLLFDDAPFEALADCEWLVTNGLGGFAMGTLSGANTRRYHGLLVAALQPPTHRHVIVSKLEETIQIAGLEQLPPDFGKCNLRKRKELRTSLRSWFECSGREWKRPNA